MSGFEMGKSR